MIMMRLMKVLLLTAALTSPSHATSIDAATQAKIAERILAVQSWAGNDLLLAAVKQANAGKSAEAAGMTQEKWASLSVLDPFVRAFSKNSAADFLKSKKDDVVTEAFISAADGTKVAFLAKPSNWCHKGKSKHDVPMSGKTWQGDAEVDSSTGLQQVQIAVPLMEGGQPIGSLVVGLSISALTR